MSTFHVSSSQLQDKKLKLEYSDETYYSELLET